MKLQRIVASGILDALRSLDSFTFAPEVIDKIVDNIVQLKKVALEMDSRREELAKQLQITPGETAADSPQVAKFNVLWMKWVQEEVEVNLTPLTREELNLKTNRLPITVRERLLPLMQA